MLREIKLTSVNGWIWMISLSSSQILELVKKTAKGMRDPDAVKNKILRSQNVNPDPINPNFSVKWSDTSLGGFPGVLILLAELDHLFPDEKWDSAAHAYVLKLKESIETKGIHSLSMYGGLAGVCFAIRRASRNGTRYQKLINKLDQRLIQGLQKEYIDVLKKNLQNRQPSPIFLYDAIQGISGIGIYGLQYLSDPSLYSLVKEILNTLVCLTEPIEIEGRRVPGWYVPPHYLFHDTDRQRFPKGNFNLGLSHGIPAVVAFLSIASIRGVVVEGQHEAIKRVVNWIQKHRVQYRGGFSWNAVISFQEEIGDAAIDYANLSRDAWCYGTPGISSTLFLAGKALQDEQLKRYALESLCSVFSRTQEEWFLPGPTCCHGIAGLLLITQMMSKECCLPELNKNIERLTEILLDFYKAEHPFGFKNFESCKCGGYAELDDAGFLEGSSGILLTLLSLNCPTSWWDAPLLIRDGYLQNLVSSV